MFFLNQEINPGTTSNPESKSKSRVKEHEHQRTWTSNQQEKKKHTHTHTHTQTWTSPNQRASTRANTGNPHETTPKPNHPKNRNPAKHPTHPLPNQTIIKEISNTTTS